MFLKNFKTTSPISIIFFIVFALLFCCLPIFKRPISEVYYHPYFASSTIFILGLFLPLLQSVGLNNLIYEKDVIKKNNLVLAPVFLLLGTPFISHLDEWIISFLLLFYLNILFSAYQKDKPFTESFNANFLLGTIGIFYSKILLLFPLIIVVFLTFRNMSIRSVIISLMGLMMPFLFYWAYTFFFDVPFSFSLPVYSFVSPSIPVLNNLSYAEITWYFLLAFILLFSFLELLFWLYKKSIRSRKSFLVILSYFCLLMCIDVTDSYYLVLTPIAIIVANFFVYSKRGRFAEILFFLFILSSIYYRISI